MPKLVSDTATAKASHSGLLSRLVRTARGLTEGKLRYKPEKHYMRGPRKGPTGDKSGSA